MKFDTPQRLDYPEKKHVRFLGNLGAPISICRYVEILSPGTKQLIWCAAQTDLSTRGGRSEVKGHLGHQLIGNAECFWIATLALVQ